jgi:hypothetical protein
LREDRLRRPRWPVVSTIGIPSLTVLCSVVPWRPRAHASIRAADGMHLLPDYWCRRPARGSLAGLQTAVMLSDVKLPSTVRWQGPLLTWVRYALPGSATGCCRSIVPIAVDIFWKDFSESVRRLYQGLLSFRNMRRMEASLRKARALRLRFSQSLASRRQRFSQAIVRSTNACTMLPRTGHFGRRSWSRWIAG